MPPPAATDRARAGRRTAMRMLVAAFAVFATVTAVQTLLLRRTAGEPGAVGPTLLYSAGVWLSWLLLVPLIVRLGQRFDFRAGVRGTTIGVHLVAALLAHGVTMLVSVVLGVRMFNPGEPITGEMLRSAILLSSRLPLSILTYGGILGLHYAIDLMQALAEREATAARLQAQATQARLAALAARLHPHFLFNALQSVSALVEQDPPRARTMLALIGDLLRDVLSETDDARAIPLEEELGYLRRYLAIEEIRFADRLRVEFDIDADASRVLVPRFLLQPLAENALRHGLAHQAEGGTLRITARRVASRLELTVWNDGAPLPATVHEGVGLTTTRARLAAHHGDAASVTLGADAGGVATTLVVPA